MHIVTLGYPPNPSQDEKIAAANFFNSLAHVIPCPICKSHYQHFLKEVPVENVVGSRDELINWCFELHNKVNSKLGKKEISFSEFINNMRSLSNTSHIELPPQSVTSSSMVVGALTLAGLFGIGYYVYSKQK